MDGRLSLTNPAYRLALAYAGDEGCGGFVALFALMERCESFVRRATEPLPAQLRIAWHRAVLAGEDVAGPGDPEMQEICRSWPGPASDLVPIVDGWEELLGERPDTEALAEQMAQPLAALAGMLGGDPPAVAASRAAASVWLQVSLQLAQSARGLEGARPQEGIDAALPRSMRPLAILRGLARRAATQRRAALLGDRLSPLVALRLGIFGR